MRNLKDFILCVWGLLFCATAFAQPPLPQNTCAIYQRMATAPASTQVSNKIVSSGGPGFENRLEMPSKSGWVPKCDKDGMYHPIQTRQNKEQFCVLPKTGEIAYDPSKNKSTNASRVATSIFCDCFIQRRAILSGHVRDMVADCDEKTGFFKPVQFFPNGMSQCFSPNGTKTSDQFVNDGFTGPNGIPPQCKIPANLGVKTNTTG